MYYLRSLPKADAIQFTVDQSALTTSRALNDVSPGKTTAGGLSPASQSDDVCENCSA
jgi:hypothetical protein